MLKQSPLKLGSEDVSMKPLYSVIAVLAIIAMLVPAYGAGDSLGALPNVGNYLDGIVQFFQSIISSLVQAINKQLPAS
jgi:hypothetical protein